MSYNKEIMKNMRIKKYVKFKKFRKRFGYVVMNNIQSFEFLLINCKK